MKKLLELLLEPLVSDIKKVKIEETSLANNSVNFEVKVPKEDIAKVIGRGGKMVKAIKNLLKIRAFKENVFVNLEIIEA